MSKQPPSSTFESCFAQGLDLSELATAPAASSYSAALLVSTQKRAEQVRHDEAQQVVLRRALQERMTAMMTQTKTCQNKKHAALLHMHEQDEPSRTRLVKEKKGPKTLAKGSATKRNIPTKHAKQTKKSGKRRGGK